MRQSKPQVFIAYIDLSNDGLILAAVVISSDPVTNWNQMYSTMGYFVASLFISMWDVIDCCCHYLHNLSKETQESDKMTWWAIEDFGEWRRGCNKIWILTDILDSSKSQNRIASYPELKAVFSCPFRAQGEGAQLPAFPSGPVLTLDALRLPTGHEPTTPYHDEATRQCSLNDDWKSR